MSSRLECLDGVQQRSALHFDCENLGEEEGILVLVGVLHGLTYSWWPFLKYPLEEPCLIRWYIKEYCCLLSPCCNLWFQWWSRSFGWDELAMMRTQILMTFPHKVLYIRIFGFPCICQVFQAWWNDGGMIIWQGSLNETHLFGGSNLMHMLW